MKIKKIEFLQEKLRKVEDYLETKKREESGREEKAHSREWFEYLNNERKKREARE